MILLLALLLSSDGPSDLPTVLSLDEPVATQDPGQDRGEPERPSRPDQLRATVLTDWEDAFSTAATVVFRFPQGSTRVREKKSVPALLKLDGDLDLDSAAGGRLSFRVGTPSLYGFGEVEAFKSAGHGIRSTDFSYDEGSFKGGVPYRSGITGVFARAGVAFKDVLPDPVPGSWMAPFVGLEYPLFSLAVKQGSIDSSSEQWKQFVPYPIVGVLWSVPLEEDLKLLLRAYAGYVPTMDTPFVEGGRLTMSIATFNAEATLTWRLSPSIRLTGSLGWQYWHGTLNSHEDGDNLTLKGLITTFGIEIAW